jgi:hypothetical protein
MRQKAGNSPGALVVNRLWAKPSREAKKVEDVV